MTEIGDGRYDGQAPLEELNAIEEGAFYGWPRCIDDGVPVEENGGTQEECAAATDPVTTFPAQSTPTGLAASPFDDGALFVALWNADEVVRVDPADGSTTPFLTGLDQPQNLAATDGALLASDHARGVVYRVERD